MQEIIDHYESEYREDERLAQDLGVMELMRTQELLLRDLPQPPASVLDIGGGPGVYSAWMVALGYHVQLIDVVPRHVARAAGIAGIASARIGDARSLDVDSESIDAVLLLGPLYHLIEREDRLKALREAARVLRPGGVVFAAAISRFASLLHGLFTADIDDPEFRTIVRQDLQNGQHRSIRPEYFTTAYFHHPQELGPELTEAGFELLHVTAIEGPAWVADKFNERWADPDQRAVLLEFTRAVEREPALLGMSNHILAVGRKPAGA